MSECGQLSFDDHQAVITLSGEVDLQTSIAVHALVETALGTSPHVVFDMGEVTFLDSTGLRALCVALRCTREGGSVAIRNASEPVLRVMRISGLDRDIPTMPALASRVAS